MATGQATARAFWYKTVDGDQRSKVSNPPPVVNQTHTLVAPPLVKTLNQGIPEGGPTADFDPLGDLDEDRTGLTEWGAVPVPAFPREAVRFFAGHETEFTTLPMHAYTQANPRYQQVVFPEPMGDDASGLPEEDSAVYSVSASDSAMWNRGRAPVDEAQKANLAHQANLIMSDTEQSATGATGVWSIAGRA